MATEILTTYKPDGTEVSTMVKGSTTSCCEFQMVVLCLLTALPCRTGNYGCN